MLEHGFNNGVGFIKNKKILPSFREATEKLPHKKQKKGWSSSETVNPILNIFFLRLDRGIFFFVKNYIFSVVPFTSSRLSNHTLSIQRHAYSMRGDFLYKKSYCPWQ
jgi:hypothetical protein